MGVTLGSESDVACNISERGRDGMKRWVWVWVLVWVSCGFEESLSLTLACSVAMGLGFRVPGFGFRV